MTANLTARLTACHPLPGYPIETTLGDLIAFAKAKLGKAYAGIDIATYGGGTQVEVRKHVNGYHGRRISREQCYDFAE